MKNILLLAVLIGFQSLGIAQSIELIPNPATFVDYEGYPIVANNNLYVEYRGNNQNLVKYDGNNFTVVPSYPGYGDSTFLYHGYQGTAIQLDSFLYLQFNQSGYGDLFQYNMNSMVLSQITSNVPMNGGYVVSSTNGPVVIDSLLFIRYKGADGNYDLYKYNGSSLTEIASPVGYDDPERGYTNEYGIVGNKLFVVLFNNASALNLFVYNMSTGSFQQMPNPAGFAANYEISSHVTVGTNLYMKYRGGSSQGELYKYDSVLDTLLKIPNPTGYYYFGNQEIVTLGNDLYLCYADSITHNFSLFRFNTLTETFTHVPNPTGFLTASYKGFVGMVNWKGSNFAMGTNVYLKYQDGNGNFSMAQYNSVSGVLSIIPTPPDCVGNNKGYSDATILGTDIYIRYLKDDNTAALYKYNGSTLTLIPSPPGVYPYPGGWYNDLIAFNNNVYMRTSKGMGRLSNKSFSVVNAAVCDGSAYSYGDSTWTTTGVYPIPAGLNAAGYDSTVYVNLVYPIFDTNVTLSGATLTGVNNGLGATYQWVDCDNNYTAIVGATTHTFSPTADGNYALVISKSGCADTSACTNVVVSGINIIKHAHTIHLFPNPTSTQLNIESELLVQQAQIYSINGALLKDIAQPTKTLDVSDLPQGMYILMLKTEQGYVRAKFVKE